ncbi:MAG: urease accessory protein [Verrucomicrobiota bacterium]
MVVAFPAPGRRMKNGARPAASRGVSERRKTGDAPPSEFTLWQLADSAFPTGGFAHSSGLEAACQHGEIRAAADLRRWIEASLEQLLSATLPFVNAAHRQPSRLCELDALCEAFTSNHVARRASRLQGRAWLSAVTRIFKSKMEKWNVEELPFSHLGPVFGVLTRALGLSRMGAIRLFVFMHLRGIIAAAVRLNVVGPTEAQAIQHQCGDLAASVARRSGKLTIEDLAQTVPLLELWQGTQDRLYSRLFQS